ncbi:unnamed protein product [Clavelina lepadiformis]|uniref:Phosphoserine aminotransferase n=1 Tax=Clavelina lepadiformis TaxID=159417 RepID=A0ABP0FF67_CLALP
MALINGHANGITASDIKLARKNGVMSNGTHNGLDNKKPIINFNPGPAKIDPSVLLRAQAEILNFQQLGISVMEMSHRSADFAKILNGAKATLTQLLNIPENYKILFLQGGATAQFSAVPLNLLQRSPNCSADYIVTGTWSAKAVKEAQKYGKVHIVHQPLEKYSRVPEQEEFDLDPEAAYVYYCDNETVNGVEFSYVPDTGNVPLVADMSSNILSKPVDVSKFGIILAGAQKNIGCAGVTLAIIREDLVGYCMKQCPTILDYKIQIGMDSLYNTPPSYSIYLMGLVLEWIQNTGGLLSMAKKCVLKSQLVYSAINESNGFYSCAIEDGSRSRMNVTFRIDGPAGDSELENAFIEESKAANMIGLKGHRSVGGIRASLYNAVTLEETQFLVNLMMDFQRRHS